MKKFIVVMLTLILFTGCSNSSSEPKQLSCSYNNQGEDQTIVFIPDKDNLVDKIYGESKIDVKKYLTRYYSDNELELINSKSIDDLLKEIEDKYIMFNEDPLKYQDYMASYNILKSNVFNYVDDFSTAYYKENYIYFNFLVDNMEDTKEYNVEDFYGVNLDQLENIIKQKIKREEIVPLECKLVDGKKYDKPVKEKNKLYIKDNSYETTEDFEEAITKPVYLRKKYEIVEIDGVKGYLKFYEDKTCDIDLTEFNKSYPAGDNRYTSQECAKTKTPEEYKYEYQKSKCTWSKSSAHTFMIKYTGKYNVYRTCKGEVIQTIREDYYVDDSLNSSSYVSRDYTDIRVDFNEDYSKIEFDYGTKAFMRSSEHSRRIVYKNIK